MFDMILSMPLFLRDPSPQVQHSSDNFVFSEESNYYALLICDVNNFHTLQGLLAQAVNYKLCTK